MEFSVTLYADDTYLILSDNRMDCFERIVNNELDKFNYRMQAKKLPVPLNYSQTDFMPICKDNLLKGKDLELQVYIIRLC